MKKSFLFLAALVLPVTATANDLPAVMPTKPLQPQTYHFTLQDLPEPFASKSASKSSVEIPLPDDISLNVPGGFQINIYATGLSNPRWPVITPEGDVLVAESAENRIVRLIDSDKDGDIDTKETFADEKNGLNQPFGMAFDGKYFFVGNTDAVIRFPYKPGDKKLKGEGKTIAELPDGGHWTRNLLLSPDKQWLYVAIGSASNVNEEPLPRASIMKMRTDGSEASVYASGLRNPVGLALHPVTHEIYTSVNERDQLGDELVPDYITHVERGKFYGWPYAYLSPEHPDPRRMKDGKSTHPEKVAETTTPDVLLQAHSAVLGITFAHNTHFPDHYKHGIFASLHGSWNRSKGTGYKLIYVPFDSNNRPTGFYEDFVTGFLTKPDVPETWGRPVGIAVLQDGSLIFTDDANGRIFRVTYSATEPYEK